jgi:DNA-nicking Smr family endonuclease
MSSDSPPAQAPVELQIDGVLDLHTFRPREIGDLIPDWLAACQERGLLELRIIHGKGIGNLQRSVHAILSRHPEVARYSIAAAHYGGTGATIVHLRPPARKKG